MAKKREARQGFLKGAAILAVATVIIKILGAIYKIPLRNILGVYGIGLFNSAYNVYNVLLTLSTAGLPVALSKMVSEASTLERHNQARKIFKVALVSFGVIGLVCSLVMFGFAEQFANIPDTTFSIMALAPAVFLVYMMSAYRGYLQGLSNMTPTAVSQVLEVAVKLVIGLSLAIILMNSGYGVTYASAGAIIGVACGSLVALFYLWSARRKHERLLPPAGAFEQETDSTKSILKRLFVLCIPITLGSSVQSIITLIDTYQITARLQSAASFTETAAGELFGAYSSQLTLFNLPPAFVVPLTLSIIPAVTSALTRGDKASAARIGNTSMRITAILALPAAAGMCVLASPIVTALYGDATAIDGQILSLLAIASFFVCMSLVTNAILQAYGKMRVPIYTMLVGGVVKIVINYFLVGNPAINIMGAPIGALACYAIISLLNLIVILRTISERPNYIQVFIKPCIASVIMGAAAYFTYPLFYRVFFGRLFDSARMSTVLALGFAVVIGVVVYAILIVAMRIITKEDLKLVPKGEKIANLLHIR